MQIVIDIPDEMYQKIKETNMVISGRRSGKRIDYLLFNVINTGTPLPKGHGDLIYRDDLIKDFRDNKKGFWRKKHFIKGEATMESMAYEINDIVKILNDAKTIIEADKEEV